MFKTSSLLLIVIVTLVALGAHAKHYPQLKWDVQPDAKLCPKHPISFTLFLRQQNRAALEQKVREVSDPRSPLYGRYLSVDDVTAIVQPTKETLNAVDQWLAAHSPLSVTYHRNMDSIKVVMARENVEKMMKVHIQKYTHQITGNSILRSATDPVIDSSVAAHIDLITGISQFPI
ncbi:hypothetical protein SAMD00019534_104850, partial [Acytostelium subglobosum LB1]|uniref:hypothetical protein n=1 Tax=Acytostelium subglobosum LB1 TaxID=1410327 RepID=UPI000644C7B3